MKKIIVYTGILMAITSCNLSVENKDKSSNTVSAKMDSIAIMEVAMEMAAKAEAEADSISNAEYYGVSAKSKTAVDSIIKINKIYSDAPNSAGGVDMNIIWTNKSKETVKYIRFCVLPYNAVNDVCQSSIGGDSKKWLKSVGPIKSGKTTGRGELWDCVWYNHSITHVKLVQVSIEYMNGSKVSIPQIYL